MSMVEGTAPPPEPTLTPAPPAAPPTPAAPTAEPKAALEETLITPKPKEGDPAEKPPEAPKPFSDADLKVPAGIAFDGDQRKEFSELVGKYGLTHDAAQGLLDYGSKMLKAAAEAHSKLWADTNESWTKAVRTDSEIGGDKLDAEVRPAIARLLDEYAADRKAVVEALNMTGAGNNPHIIKMLWRMSKVLNESRPVNGDPAGSRPKTFAEAMYPSNQAA